MPEVFGDGTGQGGGDGIVRGERSGKDKNIENSSHHRGYLGLVK